MARADEMMQALLQHSPDSIFFKDLGGKFVAVSEAKAANSGTTIEDMVGKTDFDFLLQEQAEAITQDDKAVIETGESIVDKVEKLTRPDGTETWVSASKAPWRDAEGKIIGEVTNVSGPQCAPLSAWLDEIGDVIDDRSTPDYHKQSYQTIKTGR